MKNSSKSDVKEKILKGAAELFSRDGYYKVSVREICEAAGVTKPVLYYYFDDKESLLFEMMQETRKTVNELIEIHVTSKSNIHFQLEGIIEFYIEFINKYPHLMKFSTIVQFMNVPEKVKKYKYDTAKEDWTAIKKLFTEAQNEGYIAKDIDPMMLSQNFFGSIIAIISRYMMNHIGKVKLKKELYSFLEFWKNQFVIKKV
ncbi:MAG: TetR/AcrR family transcriptional regulator [Melioribacteraceae bacterium]|nr:TetR/AcrR family transcriptional regulator [Melioribacteraceae bacterium]